VFRVRRGLPSRDSVFGIQSEQFDAYGAVSAAARFVPCPRPVADNRIVIDAAKLLDQPVVELDIEPRTQPSAGSFDPLDGWREIDVDANVRIKDIYQRLEITSVPSLLRRQQKASPLLCINAGRRCICCSHITSSALGGGHETEVVVMRFKTVKSDNRRDAQQSVQLSTVNWTEQNVPALWARIALLPQGFPR
jgi:hypothetical protein